MSYLKDLPCAGCGTESTYYFPDKPTAHYCYCEFRFEIGEQIAREIEADKVACLAARVKTKYIGRKFEYNPVDTDKERGLVKMAYDKSAAIARGQDEFPLVLDGRNDGSVIHAEDLRKTAREWRREK